MDSYLVTGAEIVNGAEMVRCKLSRRTRADGPGDSVESGLSHNNGSAGSVSCHNTLTMRGAVIIYVLPRATAPAMRDEARSWISDTTPSA